METRAYLKGTRLSAQKAGLVADVVRGKSVHAAMDFLTFHKQKASAVIKKLLEFDVIIIAGQAKSHCVAWTIDDLLNEIKAKDPELAKKVYLLEDCTSPVVIPGVIDFTDQANEAFKRFADEGMNVVKSTDPINTWPGIKL